MKIALYAFDGITMFHLAAPLMVFGEVTRLGLASDWKTQLWSDQAGSVRTMEGYTLGDIAGPAAVEWADIVIVPSWPDALPPIGDALREQLRTAHRRGAEVAGLCLGAFPITDTGLLEGRAAVTHWTKMADLRERNAQANVDESVLYIDHGDVMTSAGTASSIVPAHRPQAPRFRGGHPRRPKPGRRTAPRRRAGTVHRTPTDKSRRRHRHRRRHAMGPRKTPRAAVDRAARRAGADEPSKFHQAVPAQPQRDGCSSKD